MPACLLTVGGICFTPAVVSTDLVPSSSYLEFIWADCRSAAGVLARRLAEKVGLKSVTVDGVTFLRVAFQPDQLLLANEIFKLIGGKPSTQVLARGIAAVNRAKLRAVLECHASAVNSESAGYCHRSLARVGPASTDLVISLTVLGLSTHRPAPVAPTGAQKRLYHPCRLCYLATHPQPQTSAEWEASVAEVGSTTHARICPRFQAALVSK